MPNCHPQTATAPSWSALRINHKESFFPYNNNTLFHPGFMSNLVP